MPKEPFYAIYNSGRYSLSEYKVVWTRVGNDIKAAVVSIDNSDFLKDKIVIPIETVVFIPLNNLYEAHFVCSLINTTISRFAISSYANKGTGSFGSPHIFKNINIHTFDSSNSIHQDLSKLSQQCHEKTAAGIDVSDLEEQIDELAGELWGLTKEELKDIQESLEELR